MDQHTYFQGVLRVSVVDKKIQHGSTQDPTPLLYPVSAAVDAHVGCTWVTDTPEAREWALRNSRELPPAPVLRYMGTNIFLQGKPTTPLIISAFRAEIWG